MVLPAEPEFEQAVKEVTSTLGPFLAKHPEYQRALDVAQIPERVIQFRVVWEDDKGVMQVNRGFRVQVGFNLILTRTFHANFLLVQLSPRTVQGWASLPSLCQPFHLEILGYAGVPYYLTFTIL